MGDDISSEQDGDATEVDDTVGLSHPVILRRMPLVEAELARAKLDSEGIASFVRDANIAVANPFVVSEVPLMVGKEDVERARELLAQPAADDADGDYADEPWRCPKCHHKAVDLLPMSLGWRQIRMFWVMLLVVPILLMIFAPDLIESGGESLGRWILSAWFIAAVVIGVAVFVSRRTKRCRQCGYEWTGTKSADSTSD